MFTDDPATPLRLETLLNVLREFEGEASREDLQALMEPPGLPDATAGTKGVTATIRAALELELVTEERVLKLRVPRDQTVRSAVLDGIDAKVLSGVEVEPYFARFYSYVLASGHGDMGNRKQEAWASDFRERCKEMGLLENPFNPTKLTALLRWYRYSGLGWHDPDDVFQCCPAERIRRRLSAIFGKRKNLAGDAFVEGLSRACPELDGGTIYREVDPAFDPAHRELSSGVSHALVALHEDGWIRLHCEPDSRGWSIAAASPPRDATLRSERIDSVELLLQEEGGIS